MTSPLTIEIIIHYYVSPDSAGDFRDSPAFRSVAKDLVERGLLVESSGLRKFEANREACKVYMDAICSVPFPAQKWVLEDKVKKDFMPEHFMFP